GGGLDAYENGFPEALDLVLDWLREPRVAGRGERFGFREVAVVPRADELLEGPEPDASGPETIVACTSPRTVRLAAARALPMLLGMHCGDEEKAEMVALWRTAAREAGHPPEVVEGAAHVSAGVAQIADGAGDATELLVKTMPGWLRQGLDAHVTVDGRHRVMRDPVAYTELLCGLHPVGTPRLAADRLAATAERTGITRFALLVEGSGDLAATEENVRRLGADVLPLLT
ncbi:LLM class flavin-dependent oxidoreductase, partial [Streptomyces sp. SID7982]|nr:LLM class flavin-dependent oxidoreductase [Streptomyces sp. SID7982]